MEIDYYKKVEALERRVISEALQEARGNQAQAARLLGLAPTTLSSQLRRLGIQVRDFKRSSPSESFETFQRFLLWKSAYLTATPGDVNRGRVEKTRGAGSPLAPRLPDRQGLVLQEFRRSLRRFDNSFDQRHPQFAFLQFEDAIDGAACRSCHNVLQQRRVLTRF